MERLRPPHALQFLLAFGVLLAAVIWAATREASVPPLGTAVEYAKDTGDAFRLVTDPAVVAALDAGSDPSWQRTGGELTVVLAAGRGVTACSAADGSLTVGTRRCPQGAATLTLAAPAASCPPATYPVYLARRGATARLTTDPTLHARMMHDGFAGGVVGCSPRSEADLDADVVRLLEQASLGPTEALVRDVKARGMEAWLDEQVRLPATRYTPYPFSVPPDDPTECVDDATPPVTPASYCHTYRVAPWPVGWEFFRQARTAPDQLRLRLAHAWHQIFVVSDGPGTYAYAEFHQMLRDNALGSFETLLTRYSLSPFLGEYQNWLFNEPERDGLRPNENFAREIMQLFSIGVTELDDDGTPKLDGNGVPIPTYGQADIETLARVFTGFGFPPLPGKAPEWRSTRYYIGDMVPFEAHHDRGAKRLLGGRIDIEAGGTALRDVQAAIHSLVMHSNTPPFIGRQLIQKLVTSNPSPGYVARVSAVFKDNGRGVRGDLAAVTKAILLDPEARGARKIDPAYGRLREPVLFWTALVRGLDVTTDGVIPYEHAALSGQRLFLAPSVFNYYASDHVLANGELPAPEFAIYGSSEFLNRSNQLVELLYDADLPVLAFHYGPRPYVVGATGTPTPTLTAFVADAADPVRLVTHVDRLFLHGTMSPAMRRTIVTTVERIPPQETLARARMALRLALGSIDYQVQK